jgi:hypothetical protein
LRQKLEEKNFIKFEKQSRFIDKKPYCESGDFKKTFINNEIGKVNFSNGKGKRKKYLGVIVK